MGFSLFGIQFGGGYDGARRSKDRPLSAYVESLPKDEDNHVGRALDALRLEGSNLDRNHGLLYAALNRICDYSLPPIKLRFETKDKAWNLEAERYLVEWFRVADSRRRTNFSALCKMGLRMSIINGDGGWILRSDGSVTPVEAERILTPTKPPANVRIVNGVELDAEEVPVAYWVAPRAQGGLPDAEKSKRIPASEFVYFAHLRRFDEVRGIPKTAAAIPDFLDQKDLHRAYVRKTRSDASLAFSVHTEDGHMPENVANMDPAAAAAGKTTTDGLNRPTLWERSGLKALFLRTAEKVTPIVSSTPSTSIVAYEEHLVRYIAAQFGIPYEFLLLDLRGLSWSTSNAVVKMAGDAFREIHRFAEDQFIRDIINWRLMLAIQNRELSPAPIDDGGRSEYRKYSIGVPEYMWANESEHIEAAAAGWKLSVKSLDDIGSETGKTGEELLDAKVRDIELAIQKAKGITERTQIIVPWDVLINVGVPGVVSSAIAADEKSGQSKGKDDAKAA